ncbi:PIN-like domain-containing protein [Streptomyces sp. NPDC058439]|uniref:PIN-like domain-containing protein n=1 Tax=Streptomyces sp. NPDC058439 TaxID=3346500 RepID=UPI00364F569D
MVVLDTNVLLNLYRSNARTRQDTLAVLTRLRDRLWVPHQVLTEFWRNREQKLVPVFRPCHTGGGETGDKGRSWTMARGGTAGGRAPRRGRRSASAHRRAVSLRAYRSG